MPRSSPEQIVWIWPPIGGRIEAESCLRGILGNISNYAHVTYSKNFKFAKFQDFKHKDHPLK